MEGLGGWEGAPGDLTKRSGGDVKAVPGRAMARDGITAPLHRTLAELEELLGRMSS